VLTFFIDQRVSAVLEQQVLALLAVLSAQVQEQFVQYQVLVAVELLLFSCIQRRLWSL
jgi:hypothetical protein